MKNLKRFWPYALAFLLLVHLFFLLNLKFTAWPEMLAWPYFILKGWLPYRDIAIAHTPLLVFDLTLFYKIFGAGVWQIKAYSYILIIASDLVVFWVARRLFSLKTAILALALFIPLQLLYEGNGLWFDYLMAPLALLSFYFIREKRYLMAGFLWGLAFFTKQTAFWFLPGVVYLFWSNNFWYKIKEFACGALIVTTIIFVTFLFLGILPSFLYWAFEFGIGVLPGAAGQVSLPEFKPLLIALFPFSILAFGLIKDRKRFFLITFWAVLGIMGAFPRWELFHLQPALPFLAIGVALVITNLNRHNKLSVGILAAYLLLTSFLWYRVLIRDWREPDRFLEPSVIKTAEMVKSLTGPDERIFILNSWDSLYALSDRMPAVKPWIPQLPWYLSLPSVKISLVGDLLDSPPALIVTSPYTKTGLSSLEPIELTDIISRFYSIEKVVDNSFYILKPYR
jgi:hypothetical protein